MIFLPVRDSAEGSLIPVCHRRRNGGSTRLGERVRRRIQSMRVVLKGRGDAGKRKMES